MTEDKKRLLGKIVITGQIVCQSGLHIGGSGGNLDIGGINNAIIRDPLTFQPYIPGSGLKGKMRALFENITPKSLDTRKGRHECSDKSCCICRLFGSISKKEDNIPSRLIVRDAFLTKETLQSLETIETDLIYAEWKTATNIHRITAKATPRQYERVPKGSAFDFSMVYNVQNLDELAQDLQNIFTILRLLEDDALGGNGSRGHGKIKFTDIKLWPRNSDYYLEGEDVESKEIYLDDQDNILAEICSVFKENNQRTDD